MMIARGDRYVPVHGRLTMASWIRDGHELGHPTAADLEYHLTTLFPPVRPNGRLEFRPLDSLPGPWWRVAVAVTAALLLDEEACELAGRAVAGTSGLWLDAARDALTHDGLRESARACFDIATAALGRMGAHRGMVGAVMDYAERYVACGRTPADERLDLWARTGATSPMLEEILETAWT